MIRIGLFCAEPVVSAGFTEALRGHHRLACSAVCDTLGGVVTLLRTGAPDLLLLCMSADVRLSSLKELRSIAPRVPIVLWVDTLNVEFASQALATGVRGILRRKLPLEKQFECLERVYGGEMWVERELGERIVGTPRFALNPRERQIVRLLAQGLKNREMAEVLGLTEGSIKVYLSRLFVKVGANDRLDLALFALKNLCCAAPADGTVPENEPLPTFMTFDRARTGVFKT